MMTFPLDVRDLARVGVRACCRCPGPFSTLCLVNAHPVHDLPFPTMRWVTRGRPGCAQPPTARVSGITGSGSAPGGQDGRVSTHFDLAIIGTGSGNSIVDE